MFLNHFGLSVNPFGLSPRLDFLYKSNAFEESMAHLVYGLDNSEAIVMITGSIGTGKTMAIQSFLNNLGPSFTFALVTNTKVNSLELLKLILEDLDVNLPKGCDKSDVLILFKDFLIAESKAGRKVLIVIDEAQNLESNVLEEIRLLTNLGQGEGQPVQLILLGQPELTENINAEGLAQLRQRIRVHYNLDTLTREELEGYINHRMAVAGCARAAFSKQALDRIFKFSNGVPRLVNSLAGNGLLSAFVAERQTVAGEDIDPDELMGVQDVSKSSHAREDLPVKKTKRPQSSKRNLAPLWILLFVILIGSGWVVYQNGFLDNVLDGFSQRSEQLVTKKVVLDNQDQLEPPVVEDVKLVAAPTDSSQVAIIENIVPEEQPVVVSDPIEPVVIAERFEVHIASFKSLDRANALISRLSPITTKAYPRDVLMGDTVWHRVYLGPYATQEEAEEWVEKVQAVHPVEYFMIGKIPDDGNSAG